MGLAMIGVSLGGFSAGFMPNWQLFLVAWILIHISMQVAYVATNVYAVEILGQKLRQLAIMRKFRTFRSTCSELTPDLASMIFAIGYGTLSLTHYFIPNWTWFTFTQACIGLLYIPVWLLMPESPRWLFIKVS